MNNNKYTQNKLVLLLFPRMKIGQEIISRLLEKQYQIILFTLSAEKQTEEHKWDQYKNDSLEIIRLGKSIQHSWDNLSTAQKNKILQAHIVINFIGTDFLTMHVQGEGPDWSVDSEHPAQIRFSFIDLLLNHFKNIEHCIWVNLLYGKEGNLKEEGVFCKSRYGVMGFTNLIKLNPALKGIEVLNICLTYLRREENDHRIFHCSHCVSERFKDELIHLRTTDQTAKFLVDKIEELLTHRWMSE